jgi:hypothetical protein
MLEICVAEKVDAYIADGNFRKRDSRFAERNRFKPKPRQAKYFTSSDFNYNADAQTCECPAGKQLWHSYTYTTNEVPYVTYLGYLKDCGICPLQQECMRKPPKQCGRRVSFRTGVQSVGSTTVIDKMKTKIDSDHDRHIYSRRLRTVEPVFGNINTTKRLRRFSHRGKLKVNAQWLMWIG